MLAATVQPPAFPPVHPHMEMHPVNVMQVTPLGQQAPVAQQSAPLLPVAPPEDRLTLAQARWIEAELGHRVTITDTSNDAVVGKVMAVSNQRQVAQACRALHLRQTNTPAPREKEAFAKTVVELAMQV